MVGGGETEGDDANKTEKNNKTTSNIRQQGQTLFFSLVVLVLVVVVAVVTSTHSLTHPLTHSRAKHRSNEAYNSITTRAT